MDTVLQRKNRKINKVIKITLPIIGIILIASFVFTKKKSLIVKREEITIKKVEFGNFEDFIVFQAKVVPLQSMLINIQEGGSIQEIFVENGEQVNKSQPLAKIFNPNTELSYVNQETTIIEQINQLNKAKLDIRTQEFNLSKELISIEHDYLESKTTYDLHQKMFEEDILSKDSWRKTQEDFRYQKERKNLIQQSIQKEKQANHLGINQLNQSLNFMQKSLAILRKNKQNFLILAPVSGCLTSFEPLLGKNYAAGESIGKIDVQKGYKLIADVDEFYLDKIAIGQTGAIEYFNKQVHVSVNKIVPEIKNGTFLVELNFIKNEKNSIQQGLSFGVRLSLSEKSKVKIISKGIFDRETEGKWIFVVIGNKAIKRSIKLGRENPLYYEIIEGLKVGEKVITSSYKDFLTVEELKLINNDK
ncbi:MAG: RND transporter [Flavobacteriia bacterium]|nr:RND transporter [Flavobacteriia bacterium]